MSVDAFKLEQEYILGFKIETSTGVYEAVTATEAGFVVYDCELTGDNPVNDRPLEGSMGDGVAVPGLPTGRISFGIDLVGKGSSGVPDWATPLLTSCGMSVSGTTFSFTGSGASQPTISFGKSEDGALRQLYGAAGTFNIKATSGGIPRINFTYQGIYGEAADAAILVPTFPTVVPPVMGSGLFTLASYTPIINEITIDAGNSLVFRPDITRTGGLRAAAITGRSTKTSFDPEQEALATRDWDAIRLAATTEAFSLTIGVDANNTTLIRGPAHQILQCPRAARNGILTRNISGRFTGASPFQIIFK